MNIVEKQISEIKPYEKNPRRNEKAIDLVVNSIKEFGFKVPLVIDKQNVIVCGHTRYLAAKKLQMKELPCIIADDLTDEQIKAFRLADNKVSEFSEWDMELLNDELLDLDLDMDMFGFGFEDDEKIKEPKERDDLSDKVAETYEVIIECADELQQEEIYTRLSSEGMKCRVLTL